MRLRTITMCVLLAAVTLPASAHRLAFQTPAGGGADQQQQREPGRGERMREGGGFGEHHGAHAGDWLRRYGKLSPEEQQKALASDPQFQQLPADRQQRLRDRLQEFNNLPPERKQQILKRMEFFEHLAPEQKERLRQYSEQFHQMPEQRRRMMHRALKGLREMPPAERERVLDSPRFTQMFSPQEIGILRGMAEFAPPPGEDGTQEQQQQAPREP
jgi:uncharacterized protein DUF3106